eukprot:6469598-Amphidinium_carterae.1
MRKQWQFWKDSDALPDLVAVQEHHRAKRYHEQDKVWMRARAASWHPIASIESGGVGVLHRTHIPARLLWEHPSGRACAVLVDTLIPHGLLFLSVYLRTGQPLWRQADLLADIVEYVKADGRCFIMCADWQCSPLDIQQSDLLQTLSAVLVNPGHPTCCNSANREIDFAIMSCSLLVLLQKVHLDHACVTRPHHPVIFEFATVGLQQMIPLWIRAHAFPEMPLVGPQQQPVRVPAYDCTPGQCEFEGLLAQWTGDAAAELARHHGIDPSQIGCESRGVACRKWVPIHQAYKWKAPRYSSKSELAWRWLLCVATKHAVRRGMGLHTTGPIPQPSGVESLLEGLVINREKWSLSTLLSTLTAAGPLEFMLVFSSIYERAASVFRDAAKHDAEAWRAWCKQALVGGARAAHAFTRGPQLPPAYTDGSMPLVGLPALQRVGKEFHEIWSSADGELIPLEGLWSGRIVSACAVSVGGPDAGKAIAATSELGVAWPATKVLSHGDSVSTEALRWCATGFVDALLCQNLDGNETQPAEDVGSALPTGWSVGAKRPAG